MMQCADNIAEFVFILSDYHLKHIEGRGRGGFHKPEINGYQWLHEKLVKSKSKHQCFGNWSVSQSLFMEHISYRLEKSNVLYK